MTDLARIQECILVTAMYYNRTDLSEPVLNLMAEDLRGYSADAVIAAYTAYRKDPKNRTMPLPAQIIGILEAGKNQLDPNLVATKLIAAVKNHDANWVRFAQAKFYKHGSFEADFMAELGAEAWEVVRSFGGWPAFCDSFWQSSNESIFKAQLRDLTSGVIDRVRAGTLIALGPTKQANLIEHTPGDGPTSIGEELKRLARSEGEAL